MAVGIEEKPVREKSQGVGVQERQEPETRWRFLAEVVVKMEMNSAGCGMTGRIGKGYLFVLFLYYFSLRDKAQQYFLF